MVVPLLSLLFFGRFKVGSAPRMGNEKSVIPIYSGFVTYELQLEFEL